MVDKTLALKLLRHFTTINLLVRKVQVIKLEFSDIPAQAHNHAREALYVEDNVSKSVKVKHRVLIVEDSLPERTRLAIILEKQNFDVLEAKDGLEALLLLEQGDISLIISDWHMPNMDGIDLCKSLKATMTTPPYFILLTGRGAKVDMVSSMDAGADDYLAKPFDAEELRVRVQAGIRLIDMQSQLRKKNGDLENALLRESALNEEIQQDLKAAEKLQRSMLPDLKSMVNFTQCAHFFKPANGVAGDTFSIIPLGSTHVAFYQIDVVGHGVRSAMLSFAISRYLQDQSKAPSSHSKALPMQSPAKVLAALNKDFLCDDDCQDYFTIVYGVMNTETGHGTLSQGGHPHPLITRANGTVDKIGNGGVPIGLFEDSDYEAHDFKLSEGDRMMVYSDGILECKLEDERDFNDAMLVQVMNNLSSISGSELQAVLEGFFQRLIGDKPPADDISMLFLEIDFKSQRALAS
jgi:phosphoserine phosphatase RsbU/P